MFTQAAGCSVSNSDRAEPWVACARWHGQGWRPSVRSVVAVRLVDGAFTLKIFVCRLSYPWCPRHVHHPEARKNCEKFAFFAARTFVFVSSCVLLSLPSCDFMVHLHLRNLIAQDCKTSAWRCPVLLGKSHWRDPLLTRLLLLLAIDVFFLHLPETICSLHEGLVSLKGTHMNVTNSLCLDSVYSSRTVWRSEFEIALFVLLVLHLIALADFTYHVSSSDTCMYFAWILVLTRWEILARKTTSWRWGTLTLFQLSFQTSLSSGTLYLWYFDRFLMWWAIWLLTQA